MYGNAVCRQEQPPFVVWARQHTRAQDSTARGISASGEITQLPVSAPLRSSKLNSSVPEALGGAMTPPTRDSANGAAVRHPARDTRHPQQALSPAWVTAVAGQVSGMAGLTVVHPLDTVKCRVQAHQPGEPVSAVNVCRSLVQTEGVRGLYKGIGAPLCAFGVISCINFTVYAQTTGLMERKGIFGTLADDGGWKVNTAGSMLSGAAAGFMSSLVRGPAERVKTVLQAGHGQGASGGSWHCAKHLVRRYGIVRGLYTGTGVTMLREIPQMSLYFLSFSTLKEAYMSRLPSDVSSGSIQMHETTANLLAGGAAGVIQWLPTYPIDVIKTRIQAEPPGTYKGFTDCIRRSIQAEGTQVFWRGCTISLIRAFPLHGTIFVTCEAVKTMLNQLMHPDGLTYKRPSSQRASDHTSASGDNVFSSMQGEF